MQEKTPIPGALMSLRGQSSEMIPDAIYALVQLLAPIQPSDHQLESQIQ